MEKVSKEIKKTNSSSKNIDYKKIEIKSLSEEKQYANSAKLAFQIENFQQPATRTLKKNKNSSKESRPHSQIPGRKHENNKLQRIRPQKNRRETQDLRQEIKTITEIKRPRNVRKQIMNRKTNENLRGF